MVKAFGLYWTGGTCTRGRGPVAFSPSTGHYDFVQRTSAAEGSTSGGKRGGASLVRKFRPLESVGKTLSQSV